MKYKVYLLIFLLVLQKQVVLAESIYKPPHLLAPSVQSSLPNGISSGDTTQNSTVLWARSAIPGVVKFKGWTVGYGRFHGFEYDVTVEDVTVPAKVKVEGLLSGRRYAFTVESPNGERLRGRFLTTSNDCSKDKALRFGVSGDWRGDLAPYPALNNVLDRPLDFFIKLGDTVYADLPSPDLNQPQATSIEEFRIKHQEIYSTHHGQNTFAKLQQHVSILSMIDDHEVSNDFAGGSPALLDSRFKEDVVFINQAQLYRNGVQAFIEFNAIENRYYEEIGDQLTDLSPDLYRHQHYCNLAAIYMLDARSYRGAQLPGVLNPFDRSQINQYLANSYELESGRQRSMLGQRQLERLKEDLLEDQSRGVLWKFILIPEPVQNLGILLASDRFEGYAAERSDLLRFIDEKAISNVVFVAADIHGTLINDLSYQRREDLLSAWSDSGDLLSVPQIQTSAFEVTTGAVAFSPSLGNVVLGLPSIIPGVSQVKDQIVALGEVDSLSEFKALPMAAKSAAMQEYINAQLQQLNYTSLGMQDNPLIDAELQSGLYSALFSFGWTRFEIQSETGELSIATFGIEPYASEELELDAEQVIGRKPELVSKLIVIPSELK